MKYLSLDVKINQGGLPKKNIVFRYLTLLNFFPRDDFIQRSGKTFFVSSRSGWSPAIAKKLETVDHRMNSTQTPRSGVCF